MEALYFLKLWRPTTHNSNSNKDHHQPRHSSGGNSDTTEIATSVVDSTTDDDYEYDEEDDSFFELELTVPDPDNNNSIKCNNKNDPISVDSTDGNRFDARDQTSQNLPNIAGNLEHKCPPPIVSLSLPDNNIPSKNNNSILLPSKRKILPVEPVSSKQPQSPISLLKSAPKFRVLMFKKSKSMAAHDTEFLDIPKKSNKKQESKFFTVKFKLKEVANAPIFTRDNSLRKQISDDSLADESSKRFSKEAIQKYLKLIKPLYIKVSRKQNEKPRFSSDLLSVPSPSASPATLPSYSPKKDKQGSLPAGIRVVCKHLGKSKSASATATAPPSTLSRRDDSLLLQHDGIQSAILHCKKSFNSSSSRDSSLLSRFASDSLHEKSMASPRISHEDDGIRI